jgi:small nuclear ribonucleoprotein (snRNP)-like protein
MYSNQGLTQIALCALPRGWPLPSYPHGWLGIATRRAGLLISEFICLIVEYTSRVEGHIIGFDEYMNLVMDDAEEVHMKKVNCRIKGIMNLCRGRQTTDSEVILE